MVMNRWVPIFSKLVDSSVWDESYPVRVLWTTMLALKDWDQVVRYDAYGLGKRANMPLEEVEAALGVLEAPDGRRPGQPFEGRRIERVMEGEEFIGWRILNGKKYEELMKRMKRRAYQAEWVAARREELRGKGGKPYRRERAYVKAVRDGDMEKAEAIVEEGL
jgi:hypothetical protein